MSRLSKIKTLRNVWACNEADGAQTNLPWPMTSKYASLSHHRKFSPPLPWVWYVTCFFLCQSISVFVGATVVAHKRQGTSCVFVGAFDDDSEMDGLVPELQFVNFRNSRPPGV
jgi:hypothetical protein